MSCFDPALVSCPLWSLIGGGKSEGGKEQICSVPTCSKPAPLTCSACQAAHYCSRWVLRLKLSRHHHATRDHQKADWTRHKSSCAPFALRCSKTRGRHLVATRNIAQGDLIFKEPPLTAGAPILFRWNLYIKIRSQTVHSSSLPWLQQTCLPAWS